VTDLGDGDEMVAMERQVATMGQQSLLIRLIPALDQLAAISIEDNP
jgi:hypothetical protein